MTNDDELLSAYIDGEASPEEVALVEGDPRLRAEARALRALADDVAQVPGPPPGLRADHLATALGAFDALGDPAGGGVVAEEAADPADPVISLSEARHRRTVRTRPEADESVRRLPAWLGTAAAAVLVVGGLGFAALVALPGGSDDEDAAVAFETAEESTDDAAEESTADEAEDDGARALAAEGESDTAADDAGGQDDAEAGAESQSVAPTAPASDETGDESGNGGVDQAAPSTTTAPPASTELVEEARRRFPEVPAPEELTELADGELLAPELSQCAFALQRPGRPVGFVPLGIGPDESVVNAELIVTDEADGSRAFTLVDGGCAPLG